MKAKRPQAREQPLTPLQPLTHTTPRFLSTVSLSTREAFKAVYDGYCGLSNIVLYLLYLKLVKGALSVFDCTLNKDGVYILDADPAVTCGQVRGTQAPSGSVPQSTPTPLHHD